MNKLLVTGGSGFLGKRIKAKYNAIAPSHAEMDITDLKQCLTRLEQYAPTAVIHCAAISDTGYCAQHPEEGYLINVLGAENMAKACVELGIKLVFASSDQVYGSGTQPHAEEEEVKPTAPYGAMKREAEQRVLQVCPEAVCLRLSWMYDVPQPERPSFLSQLQKVQTMRLSNQEYRGITWVMEVIDQIEKIIELPGGIYNAGSTNSITTYETGRKVVEQLQKQGLPSAQIEMGDWQRNLAMDISKIEQFGIHFSDTTLRLIQWIQ